MGFAWGLLFLPLSIGSEFVGEASVDFPVGIGEWWGVVGNDGGLPSKIGCRVLVEASVA